MRRASLFAAAVTAIGCAATSAEAACTVSTTSVAFGVYSPTSPTALAGYGSVRLDCHPSDSPVIAIGAGNSGSFALRRMSNGVSNLNYNLYTSAAMSLVWGDGTGGSVTVSAPKKVSTSIVYGRIPAGQNVSAGAYSDTLIVTVSF